MTSPATTLLIGGLFAWSIYRRVRRNIGRQRLRPRRIITSLVIVSLVSVLFFGLLLQFPNALLGLAGGMALGALLGLAGLRLTKFETTDEGHFFIPNTHIGVGLSALFVGRLIYRYMKHAATDTNGQPQLFQSPLTLLILGLSLGYGLTYYSGLLVHTHDKNSKPGWSA